MKLGAGQETLLGSYLETFDPLIGDQRTRETLRGTVQGIIGAESLVCAQIASFSPSASDGKSEWRATSTADG